MFSNRPADYPFIATIPFTQLELKDGINDHISARLERVNEILALADEMTLNPGIDYLIIPQQLESQKGYKLGFRDRNIATMFKLRLGGEW